MVGAYFKRILRCLSHGHCFCLPPHEDGITTDNSENSSQSVTIPMQETTNHQPVRWITMDGRKYSFRYTASMLAFT